MLIFRLVVLLASFLFAGSCKKQNSCEIGLINSNRYLNLSLETEVHSLDPRVGVDVSTCLILKMLFEGLIRIGLDGKPHPAIAERYEISEDKKTYIFHLRPSFWSNGDRITAYDFENSWKHIVNPDSAALAVPNFFPIKNVKAIQKREKELDSIGCKALDNFTLKVELENPTPYFLEILATPPFFPVNTKVDKENKNWANSDEKAFVCNGPFILKRHLFNNEIVVEKNPTYWDAKNIKLPGIHIAIITNSETALQLFEKNELDWLEGPLSKFPLDAMPALKKAGKVKFKPAIGVYWYFINTESFPFNNKKMRKAFAYAVNRKAITENILEANESPATAVLPFPIATQQSPFFPDNKPELAIQLFNEALKEMGMQKEDLPQITMNCPIKGAHSRIGEALQQQWNRVFNLNIQLERQDWRGHYTKLQQGNYQFGGMGWQSWLKDPIYIMQTFRNKSDGINMTRWENKEYQDLLTAAEKEADPLRRKEYFHKAEALLMEEMPVIPIFFLSTTYAKTETLKDVYLSDLHEIDFRWAYFEE